MGGGSLAYGERRRARIMPLRALRRHRSPSAPQHRKETKAGRPFISKLREQHWASRGVDSSGNKEKAGALSPSLRCARNKAACGASTHGLATNVNDVGCAIENKKFDHGAEYFRRTPFDEARAMRRLKQNARRKKAANERHVPKPRGQHPKTTLKCLSSPKRIELPLPATNLRTNARAPARDNFCLSNSPTPQSTTPHCVQII
ncbi:hypothetical protein TRVL_08156 [Trypanosoma vivax]|nr:hypothetical protein TRVL_08156 [Trypanosoma vivax]